MPQANSIPFETANLDLISDRPRKVPEYRFPSRERERTYSLPNRPENISFNRSNSQSDDDDSSDSDPLARMRVNLERSTFLLSRLKVGLSSKPEVIEIQPPASDSSDEYPSSYHRPHHHHSYVEKPKRHHGPGRRPDYVVAPSTMERMDSTSTNNSTQFSLEVSNYNYVGPNGDGRDDHGSEFHQLVNHGRLHNPSRGKFRPAPAPKRIISRPMTMAPVPVSSSQDSKEPPLMEGRYGMLKGRKKQSQGMQPTSVGEQSDRDYHHPLAHSHTRTMSTSSAVHPYHPPGLGTSSGRGHGHGRSLSVSHGLPPSSSSSKPTNLRRVRFEM